MKPNAKLPRTLPERIADYPEVEYADTAFRGEMESDEVWPTSSSPSGCTALPNNTQCHEYLALDVHRINLAQHKKNHFEKASIGQALFDAKAEDSDTTTKPAVYKFYNFGFAFSLIGAYIMAMGGYVAVIGFFASIFTFVVMAFDEWTSWSQELMEMLPAVLLYVGLPLAVWIIFKFLTDKELLLRFNPTPKIRLALRRDTGMVEFKKKGEFIAVPFSEVMGMTRNVTGSDGVQRLHLHLNHKHSSLSEGLDSGWGALDAYTAQERWIYHLRWELYRHYMDVTRPLPDIPEFEPYRHLDPTTREWDKQHGRPKDYWLNMDQETYEAMVDAAGIKAKTYPYDDPDMTDMIEMFRWVTPGDGKAWYQLG